MLKILNARLARRVVRSLFLKRVSALNSAKWLEQDILHVVEAQQFDKESMKLVFKTAEDMEAIKPNSDEARQLNGRIMATLFYEPSTRTRLSFEAAMTKLGGSVLSSESAGQFSSAAKGETILDTIRTVEGYADCIVLRHHEAGSSRIAASTSSVPVLNAGDGPGQHPTQALLDMYTIKREIGRLDNIKVGLIGDLAHGRTVRSLAYLLSMYDNLKFYFVAPKVVAMKDDIKEYLSSKNVPWEEVDDLHKVMYQTSHLLKLSSSMLMIYVKVAGDVDVLYQTRIQKERFQSMQIYEEAKGKFIIDKALMKLLKKDAIVMHPLPRVDEIHPEVDTDPRAAYFRQMKNGLYVRMALLKLCLTS